MSRECNSTAESRFDVNVSRELQLEPREIVNTAHCMLYFVSICFIILLVLRLLLTITLFRPANLYTFCVADTHFDLKVR